MRTRALVARLEELPTIGSTNAELVRLASGDPAAWPPPSVLITDDQTAGRGRLGRTWTAAPGDAVAVSVLLRPAIPPARRGWLSLAAGAAMAEAIGAAGLPARAKWPNDVLIRGRKVCGVLAEALPGGGGVVIGAGVNLRTPPERLPVPTATSVAIEAGRGEVEVEVEVEVELELEPDALVAAYLERLLAFAAALERAGGDAERAGVHEAVTALSDTIGRRVRVHQPDGSSATGTAVGIDEDGRLVIVSESKHRRTAVAAGDVEHLRYE